MSKLDPQSMAHFDRRPNLRIKSRIQAGCLLSLLVLTGHEAWAQTPISPASLPVLQSAKPAPAVKGQTVPARQDKALVRTALTASGATVANAPTTREAQLEARIRELESDALQKSTREVELEERLRSLEKFMTGPTQSASTSLDAQVPALPAGDPPAGEEAVIPPGVDLPGGPTQAPVPNEFGGPDAGKPRMPYTPKLKKGFAGVGPGFVISTDDDEYQLQFHNLTQFEFRQYNNQNMFPTHSTFDFPRQRLIFNGRLTKPIEYFVATNWGINNLALLDAFINLHYDDRLQFKLGRYKTPFSYEFYAEPSIGLISPERSVWYNNYGPNRDLGAMVWGQLFDKTMDYAAGVFNGVRGGNVDNNNAKDFIAYFNARLFEKSDIDLLKYWNIGGSTTYNVYNGTARPEVFRTNIPYPGDPNVSPQFLLMNPNVQSFGTQNFWSIHSAYYYKGLSLIGEYMAGYETYAKTASLTKGTHVPSNGWYIQSGYFLTGEQVTSRGMVSPLRPFNPKNGDGLGAFELTFRFAAMTLDKTIFNFAPASKWTNDVNVIDVGVNWYLSNYIKFYAGWQRSLYGEPIQAAPGLTASAPPSYWMSSTDMLWLRAQLYY